MSTYEVKKCSNKSHNNINSCSYCPQCNIFMCEECENSHSEDKNSHKAIKIDPYKSQNLGNFHSNRIISTLTDIFSKYTGTCNEQNHFNGPLDYFCKTHNKMVCGYCICKINANNHGFHKDCDVDLIKSVEPIKKNSLQNCLMTLQRYSENIKEEENEKLNTLKKANNNIVMMKDNVKKTFSDLREQLDKRESEILNELDEKYREIVTRANQEGDEEDLKGSIEMGIECGRKTEGEWNKTKTDQDLQRCIDLENYLGKLKETMNNRTRNKKPLNFDYNFFIEENPKNNIIRAIQSLGLNSNSSKTIIDSSYIYKFRECPYEANPDKKYVLNESNNVATKIGKINKWTGILCDKILEPNKIYKWKIIILKSIAGNIMIGIVNLNNFNVNNNDFDRTGWCIDINNASLYSGPPHNYTGSATQFMGYNDFKNKTKEIKVIMDTFKGNLSFEIGGRSGMASYIGIPIHERLVPFVALNIVGDSVEIMNDED